MGSEPTTLPRKPSADLMAIVAVGVTVILSTFGQAAWLDGKIERQGTNLRGEIERLADRLDLKINSLQHGQVEIRERLAGVESGLEAVERRLDGVESRLDGVESRLDGVESRLDGVESRLDAMEYRGGASPSAVAQVEAGAWRGDTPAGRDNSQRGQT